MPKKKGKKKGTQTTTTKIVKRSGGKPIIIRQTKTIPKKIYIGRKDKKTFMGVNVGTAFRELLPMFAGALVCKFAAKRFAEGGADREDWSWKNYAWGVGATLIAAIASAMLFKGRGRIATGIFQGGMVLFAYKLFVNEIAPKSEMLASWFGADEDIYPDMSGFADYADDQPEYGDVWQSNDGNDVVYGADNLYRPVSEMHRLPAVAQTEGIGVDIQPADPAFGVDIQPADPAFGKTLIEEYDQAYATF